jgi:hypothetical protein
MWGQYADKHRGFCLGFEVAKTDVKKIRYVKERFSAPTAVDEAFVTNLLFTKFSHWSYEDEYRMYITLENSLEGLYFFDFSSQLKLVEMIVGANSNATRSEIAAVLGNIASSVQVFKARAAFTSFKVVKNENEALWK